MSEMASYSIEPGKLTLEEIRVQLNNPVAIQLAPSSWDQIKTSASFVQTILNTDRTVYGINTGFGLLAQTRIKKEDLSQLQHRILLSHAAGIGDPLPETIVRLILLLKINSLSRGFSGVRPIIIEYLSAMFNANIIPIIPSKGSVGASGDLAPLAHLSLILLGEGTALYQGKTITGKEALSLLNLTPLVLGPKEGLALINGTQVSTAIALYYAMKAQELLTSSVLIGAMSVDAAMGSDVPFDPLIHQIRGQRGQIKLAELFCWLLQGSEIRQSHLNCPRIQDPYSLRCQPQVLGACLDSLSHVMNVLMIEVNAVTDNPILFTEQDRVLSGGNFHAEPVALVSDFLAIAIAEIGSIAERRLALLIDPNFNGGLPPFLVENSGVNSGFMIAQVTAAALASANKSLAHPASVDSIPTSANQEDHVSMATYAAYRLKEMVENLASILSIELLAACQGLDLRKPLKTSPKLGEIHQATRNEVPFLAEDRLLALDFAKVLPFVHHLGQTYLHHLFSH